MHDQFCNCEDCWWARGQREICPTCGCIVGRGCPCSPAEEDQDSEEGYVREEREDK